MGAPGGGGGAGAFLTWIKRGRGRSRKNVRVPRPGVGDGTGNEDGMRITNFSDLLTAARGQPEPQRLLLVFAAAELPHDATPAERAAFERGEGGALAPVLCVDKRPEEIESFDALCEESRRTGIGWDILFVGALSGRGGHAPNTDEAVQPLRMMVEAIKAGRVAQFLAVDRDGDLVRLERG